jgi:transcriptional regulatory protein RtcR
MDKKRKRVVISIIGTKLDRAADHKRFQKWRPNVGMVQQPELPIDRVELIFGNKDSALAETLISDMWRASPSTEVNRRVMDMKDPWDFEEVYSALADFARGYDFDPDAEEYLVNITTGTHVVQICWFLLAEARIVPAKLLQLSPPKAPSETGSYAGTFGIIDLDLSRYDQIARRFAEDSREAASFLKSGIATRNATFNAMIAEIEQVVVRSTAPVLLTGPTGAGKSQLAKKIFELKKGQRKVKGDFVEVNCATLRGDQAMSALFGHVKGAFTGAANERPGLLKAADGGVLFLDEIGELGLDEQAMCLRAIEDKVFLPVGSDKEVSVNFQLIAGTNRDLSEDVRKGRFREDLFARLNLWTFQLPALKDRKEDLEPNLDFELRRFLEREGQNVTFNREAREFYLGFATGPEGLWKANFRDLAASVTRMATLAPQGRITVDVAKAEIVRLRAAWGGGQADVDDLVVRVLGKEAAEEVDPFDAVQLSEVIRVCLEEPSLSAAGRRLFARSRLGKASSNDADRLKKYLARFNLRFAGSGLLERVV